MKKKYFKLLKKSILSILLIFMVFYVTVFICLVPYDFPISRGGDSERNIRVQLSKIANNTNQQILSIAKLDFGKDLRGKPINATLLQKLGKSVALLSAGLILGIVLGLLKGIFDSRKSKEDGLNLRVVLTTVPLSMPEALNIAILQMLAIWLTKHGIKVVKVAGSGSMNHMILPVIALAILPACYIARVAAISIENCYKMEYVKTALGKGCSKSRILWNHVMRNAARIVVESFTDITSIIIYNMIMVEYLFAYPGITTFLMKSVAEHDTNAITVAVVLFGLIYLLLTILFKIIKFTTLRYDMEETA